MNANTQNSKLFTPEILPTTTNDDILGQLHEAIIAGATGFVLGILVAEMDSDGVWTVTYPGKRVGILSGGRLAIHPIWLVWRNPEEWDDLFYQ